MTQTKVAAKNYCDAGGSIDLELGTKMVKDFQDKYPNQQQGFAIGKKIIEQILSQPGCEGISLFTALNEEGKETLVYVGIDKNGNPLVEYTAVGQEGTLRRVEALIGDGSGFPWW